MTESDVYWTFATAVEYGGSFYKALAFAGMKADSSNKRRLLAAFPELAATYGKASNLHRTLREGITA